MNSTYDLIEDFVDELYENGTVSRWEAEKTEREMNGGKYEESNRNS
jgi:hypothetical protein